MPIKKENRARYPCNWKAISRRIRIDRAASRCECRGECGHAHRGPGIPTEGEENRCQAVNHRPHPWTGSLVVLTVAHLDHTPENCSDDNLLAMCQQCHLAYDAEEHARTRSKSTA